MKRKPELVSKELDALEADLRKLGIHPWYEQDEQRGTLRCFHNCGCHTSLLDARFHVDPTPGFQAVLDKHDCWHEQENGESVQIFLNKGGAQ